jgi:HPt (histidine-containing phosphotransfer) domain-containing protein
MTADGIPIEDWPRLRDELLAHMKRDMSDARMALGKQNRKQAWVAIHRILGAAKWFKLDHIASLALAVQTALDEKTTPDSLMELLADAIAELDSQ